MYEPRYDTFVGLPEEQRIHRSHRKLAVGLGATAAVAVGLLVLLV